MANTIFKRKLSGSTDGMPILVTATSTLGTTIHTAVAGTTAGTYDEIWLYAYNGHTAAVNLTIEQGDASHPFIVSIASKSGKMLILAGEILQNGKLITAFDNVGSVVLISGYVNSMTDA